MKLTILKISFILGFIFLIVGIFTIKDYGINWDTINHLTRGQAYLHYFLTGNKSYSDLPKFVSYFQDPTRLIPMTTQVRSFYQNSEADFKWMMQYDGYGHPPLSDILSSAFNIVLFQKLRIINDIDAYHVYGVFVASALIALIYYWISKVYGRVAGIIATLSLGLYPLFWSEMHFNTEKDIPETFYWSIFLFAIWKGITEKRVKWILLSGVFFGLALGTKFNILFSLFVIIPWIISYLIVKREKLVSKINIKILVAGIVAVLVGFGIFIGSWPYLWPDIFGKINHVIKFYTEIGSATGVADPRFIGPFGTNTYPVIWIVTTTPPLILFLSFIGIIYGILNFRKKNQLSILFLFWLIIPIARVTWHGANIYGGIRQIMEYIPALAIFAGIGASVIVSRLKIKGVKILAIILVFICLLIPIIKTSPYEDTYFNFLIGSLKGAKAQNIPSWGNTFGSAYRQAVSFIDQNAEKGAKVVYAYELLPNVPTIFYRDDLIVANSYRSGYLKLGEYVITLTYQGTNTRSYFDAYLEREMNPLYEGISDGIPVVKVWKNDLAHTKESFKKELSTTKVKTTVNENDVVIDAGAILSLSRLEGVYSQNKCVEIKDAYIQISTDQKTWTRLPGELPDDWLIPVIGQTPKNGKFIEPFSAENARYIKINMTPSNSCLKSLNNIKVFYFN